MKEKQISSETKSRIKKLRLYRNIEILNGSLLFYALNEVLLLNGNRAIDKLYILNEKIKNLKNGLDEDSGLDLEKYSEPGITDNEKLFPKLVKSRKNK